MKKALVWLVVLAVLGLVGWRLYPKLTAPKKPAMPGGGGGPVPVTVATAVRKPMPLEFRTFGTVTPMATVVVKSQVTGLVTTVHFREGQEVKKGDPLFSIDGRPFEAALKQAQATLDKDKALQDNAVREARRQEELLQKGITSQDARDTAKANADALAAEVRADEANVENAQVQLSYCSIPSPLDGRAGEVMVKEGNVVKANDVTMATLNQIQPIQVAFAVPQQQLAAIRERLAADRLPVQARVPANGTNGSEAAAATGELTFVDNTVDPATGTIQLKATFPNADAQLWPGLFVNVVLTLAVERDALVVPAPAVQTSQKGTFVFVVKPDMTVEDRPVTVTRTIGTETIVGQGLSENDQVVTDGQLRLVAGTKIAVNGARGADSPSGAAGKKDARP